MRRRGQQGIAHVVALVVLVALAAVLVVIALDTRSHGGAARPGPTAVPAWGVTVAAAANGVRVVSVGGPARAAGLRPGDIVFSAAGAPVRTPQSLTATPAGPVRVGWIDAGGRFRFADIQPTRVP